MTGAIEAQRRHHVARLKRKWRDIFLNQWPRTGADLAENPSVVGSYSRTHTPCSRPCCGNPRHWYGEKPVQWRRAEAAAEAQLAAWERGDL